MGLMQKWKALNLCGIVARCFIIIILCPNFRLESAGESVTGISATGHGAEDRGKLDGHWSNQLRDLPTLWSKLRSSFFFLQIRGCLKVHPWNYPNLVNSLWDSAPTWFDAKTKAKSALTFSSSKLLIYQCILFPIFHLFKSLFHLTFIKSSDAIFAIFATIFTRILFYKFFLIYNIKKERRSPEAFFAVVDLASKKKREKHFLFVEHPCKKCGVLRRLLLAEKKYKRNRAFYFPPPLSRLPWLACSTLFFLNIFSRLSQKFKATSSSSNNPSLSGCQSCCSKERIKKFITLFECSSKTGRRGVVFGPPKKMDGIGYFYFCCKTMYFLTLCFDFPHRFCVALCYPTSPCSGIPRSVHFFVVLNKMGLNCGKIQLSLAPRIQAPPFVFFQDLC